MLVPVRYLLDTPSEPGWGKEQKDAQVQRLLRQVHMLDHNVGDVRERLEWLRQYIATTHPDNRCPCQQRIGVADWHDHWTDCPVGQADLDDAADELNDRQNFIAAELKTG